MKKLWKRNQIMITALALMIAIAGYLNFMGKKVDEENLFTTSAQFEEASGVTTEDGTDMAAVTDITDESLALLPEQENGAIDESAAMTDIDSMDSEDEMVYSDYLDENQAENVSAAADDAALDETAMAGTDENAVFGRSGTGDGRLYGRNTGRSSVYQLTGDQLYCGSESDEGTDQSKKQRGTSEYHKCGKSAGKCKAGCGKQHDRADGYHAEGMRC